MSEPIDKPFVVEYRQPTSAADFGSSRVVRVAAGLVAVGLVFVIVYFLRESRRTLGGIMDWILPIAAAAGGACYCTLIALNIAGRKKANRDAG
jgi:hypothetical protein